MSGAIDGEIGARLSPTLAALEQLRALLQGVDEVSIPGVVVAGAQSAGKSSVLEALGGMKLPRGQNITTRVPLVLSLQAIPGSEPHALIGGDAALEAGKRVEIDNIGAEIEALTKELAGDGAGVSAKPIYLRIVRPSGPTLTLIDLPGITHYSADDSQDIHAETVSLVTKYIENENMVILVVIPAMDDFANAEAVMLAKKFDPHGRRTLGVVTKVDNVQAGCGIRAKLRMEPGHVQLNLGFIAVVNRTPAEVENDAPAEDVRAREKKFFETNPEVAGLEKEFWGMDTLVTRVVGIQAERVQEFVPKFVKQSRRRIKELTAKLRTMPPPLADDNKRRNAFLVVMSRVTEQLKGLLTNGSNEPVSVEGNARMNIVPDVTAMYRAYAAGIVQDVVPDFFDDDYHDKAGAALKRVDGMALSNLLAGRVFNLMFREVFADDLAGRSKDLVEEVRSYMQAILTELFGRECKQYPALLKEIDTSLVDEFMESKENMAVETISNIIRAELGWVFTQDSLYSETVSNVQKMVDSVRTGRIKAAANARFNNGNKTNASPAQALGEVPIEFMQKMTSCDSNCDEFTICSLQVTLFAYTDVACRHLFDAIPKQVHLFLVDSICDEFMEWMLEKATPRDLDVWFAEDNQSKRTRIDTKRVLAQFHKGMAILKAARVRGPIEDNPPCREPMAWSKKAKRRKLDDTWA